MFAANDMFDLEFVVGVFFGDQAILADKVCPDRNDLPFFGSDVATHLAKSPAHALLRAASGVLVADNGQVPIFRPAKARHPFLATIDHLPAPEPLLKELGPFF